MDGRLHRWKVWQLRFETQQVSPRVPTPLACVIYFQLHVFVSFPPGVAPVVVEFCLSVFPEIKELSLIQGPVEPHHQRPQKAVTQRRRTREHHHCCLSPIALFSVVFRSTVSPKARLTSFPTSEPFKGAWTSDKAERKQLSASTRPDTATKCDIDETSYVIFNLRAELKTCFSFQLVCTILDTEF